MADDLPDLEPPPRRKLAELIGRHQATLARLARVEEAHRRIDIFALRAAVAAAEQTLAAAKGREPQALIDDLLAGTSTATAAIDNAAQRLTEARQALADGERAARLIEAEVAQVAKQTEIAAITRDIALGETLQADPAVAALVEKFEAARALVQNLDKALAAVNSANGLAYPVQQFRGALRIYPDDGTADTWRAAIERLKEDPDATLPHDD